MKNLGRIVVTIANYQNESQITAIAHRYLKGTADLFDLTLNLSSIDSPNAESSSSDNCGHKHLLYEFHCQKKTFSGRSLLVGVVEFLRSLGVFFDVVYDSYPYKLKFD